MHWWETPRSSRIRASDVMPGSAPWGKGGCPCIPAVGGAIGEVEIQAGQGGAPGQLFQAVLLSGVFVPDSKSDRRTARAPPCSRFNRPKRTRHPARKLSVGRRSSLHSPPNGTEALGTDGMHDPRSRRRAGCPDADRRRQCVWPRRPRHRHAHRGVQRLAQWIEGLGRLSAPGQRPLMEGPGSVLGGGRTTGASDFGPLLPCPARQESRAARPISPTACGCRASASSVCSAPSLVGSVPALSKVSRLRRQVVLERASGMQPSTRRCGGTAHRRDPFLFRQRPRLLDGLIAGNPRRTCSPHRTTSGAIWNPCATPCPRSWSGGPLSLQIKSTTPMRASTTTTGLEDGLADFRDLIAMTIPGIDQASAHAILVELGPDIGVFASRRHCGLGRVVPATTRASANASTLDLWATSP